MSALPVCFCGTVVNCQFRSYFLKYLAKPGTSVKNGGSSPASNNKTFTQEFSDNLDATTQPAAPAPTEKKNCI